jgi:hypothetical protein
LDVPRGKLMMGTPRRFPLREAAFEVAALDVRTRRKRNLQHGRRRCLLSEIGKADLYGKLGRRANLTFRVSPGKAFSKFRP